MVWVVFTFLPHSFILFQIRNLRHDDYEDFDEALKTYLSVGVGVIPPVAVLGVFLK